MELPVEAIGVALMDAAADIDDNASVSIEVHQSRIEIETLVHGSDELEALTAAKLTINEICDRAVLPV